MPTDDKLFGKVRVLNFQGQTGFDADLKTADAAYSPVASEENERVTYTISYPDPTGEKSFANFEKFAEGLPEIMQQAALEKLAKASE